MLFKRKKYVVVEDLSEEEKEQIDCRALKKEIKALRKQVEQLREFIDIQSYDNKIFLESIERLRKDVNTLKRRTD